MNDHNLEYSSKNNVIDMYDNAIRAADTKAQIMMVFATLFLGPAFILGRSFSFPSAALAVFFLAYCAASLSFFAAVYPRTSRPGFTGIFSESAPKLKIEGLAASDVQNELLTQKHDIYFEKLSWIRRGMWLCVLLVVSVGGYTLANLVGAA